MSGSPVGSLVAIRPSSPTERTASERWRLVGRWMRRGKGALLDVVAQARRSGDPSDAARGRDLEPAVGGEDEPPSGGERLEPVVAAAQAAEVVAVGLAAVGIRDDVIQVDPRDRLAAARMTAGAIP